ncbi:MAG: DNA polymerase III PolC-type [Bacteroidetes bacterium ADurb.Bin408]|nr:MAG: DNA polymerase III PolC-type [Bacteroidetes bacterium ADurb.Bin408]
MDTTFTAIDFETANPQGWSICQVGLVRYEAGVIVKEINFLVQPPDNYYWSNFIAIHGITPWHTVEAPVFSNVWAHIEPYIREQIVVAHNGLSFDFPVLTKTLTYYSIEAPDYVKKDTCRIYKKNLAALCTMHNIPLNHHDALSDARACGELYLRYLRGG